MVLAQLNCRIEHTQIISKLHFIIGFIAVSLLTLPGTPENIGIALLGITLLRIPTCIQTLRALLHKPVFLLLIAWSILALLSGVWSDNSERSLLVSPYLLLIIPALFPLRDKSNYLIFSLAIGVAIHTSIQTLMWLGIIEGIRYAPGTLSGGLHWYPPFTALWTTAVFFLLLGALLLEKSKRNILLCSLLLLPIPLSLVLAGNKTLFIVLPIGLIILAIKLCPLLPSKRARIRAFSICTIIGFANVGLLLDPGTDTNRRFSTLSQQISSTAEIDIQKNSSAPKKERNVNRKRHVDKYVNSFGLRYVWWRGGFEIWKGAPWIGHGAGSSFKQYAYIEMKLPTDIGADVEGFITPEPHSSILATAIEQGLLGIILMISFALLAFIHSIRYAYKNPSMVGLSAAWFIVIVFSLAHTIQFSSYASTLVVLLAALTLGLPQKTQIAP